MAALLFGVVVVVTLAVIFDPGDIFFPVTFFWIIPWVVGRTIRNQTMLARELAEKAERARHARDEEERRAIAIERSRIARELHDVLAHNLSVMVVQASAAQRIVERQPEQGDRGGHAHPAHRARGARGNPPPVRRGPPRRRRRPLWPAEHRARGRARAACPRGGTGVELRVVGDPVALPAGIDLTAYRIVQEALTNALKHAGSARASVTVSYEPNEVVLSIEDDGEGSREGFELGDSGGGHGLVGMRERAALYGGIVQAGRRRGGGFAVHARLPTRPLVPGAELSRRGARVSIRVLLVDDQALIRAGFRMILDAEEDMDVVGECADGTQAVDSVRRLAPDVVLMDIRMPEMDGIEATRQIAGGGGDGDGVPRVLMLTTFDLDEYVYDALRAGASGFLLKDVPAEQLVDGIRVIAQGDALLAPSVTKRLINEFSRTGAAQRSAPASLEDLTPRELEVFKLIARGMSNAEIAAELMVSETTVKTHVARVLMKLGVRDRVQAVVLAYESGVVAPGVTASE